jgi:hypothetical protein
MDWMPSTICRRYVRPRYGWQKRLANSSRMTRLRRAEARMSLEFQARHRENSSHMFRSVDDANLVAGRLRVVVKLEERSYTCIAEEGDAGEVEDDQKARRHCALDACASVQGDACGRKDAWGKTDSTTSTRPTSAH